MTEEMNKLIDIMRATSKFDTNNPEFDRGWSAAMSVVISELRGLKELEPESCQCPSEPCIPVSLIRERIEQGVKRWRGNSGHGVGARAVYSAMMIWLDEQVNATTPQPGSEPERKYDPRLDDWKACTWEINDNAVDGWERTWHTGALTYFIPVEQSVGVYYYSKDTRKLVQSDFTEDDLLRLNQHAWAKEQAEPGIAADPKASWRFDGEKYTRKTKNNVTYKIFATTMKEPTIYGLEVGIWFAGYRPTLEKAMELADEYAQANGGWAD